ncbi:MAG: adenylate/guanylate cyclase domain-containing protein [Candidatus Wallbacteria bacterium]|nr:adenylate/guanylate cyclase domain-containing protein [Candidatus Wallbacteria bacterium]
MIKCSKCQFSCPDGSKFCLECGVRLDQAENKDELKLVSILFADLKGFTSMSEKLEPDAVKEIIDEIFQRLTGIISSEGGEVIKYEGDCIMAAFGLTVSSDLDPMHSCYAALRMRNEVSKFSAEQAAKGGARLEIRIGIHTGKVVKGLIGGKTDILGDAVNLAARMEQNAPTGEILITADHSMLLKGRFKIQSYQKLDIKGKNEPVQTILVKDRAPIRQRSILGHETAFLGRSVELASCIKILEQLVTDKKPHLIVIEGPPGIGKSRVMREFNRHCDTLPYDQVMTSVYYDSSVKNDFRLMKVLFQQKFGVVSAETLASHLSNREASWDDLFEHSRILAFLTSLKTDYSPQGDPEIASMAALKAAEDMFLNLTKRDPYIFFLDDLQWIDEASVELIQHLLRWGKGRLLFACTARPEWREQFKNLPDSGVTVIPLPPLSSEVCRSLLENATGSVQVPDQLVSMIENAAGGSPLFIEEILISLSEAGILNTGPGAGLEIDTVRLEKYKIPGSIGLVLQSRLESMNKENLEILKKGSITSMQFIPEFVSDLCGKTNLGENIEAFIQKGFLLPSPEQDILGYRYFSFSHALLRDATLNRLTKKQKIKLHDSVAKWFLNLTAAKEHGSDLNPRLYSHYLQAENIRETVKYGFLTLQQLMKHFRIADALPYFRTIEPLLSKDGSLAGDGKKAEFLGLYSAALTASGENKNCLGVIERYLPEFADLPSAWIELNLKKMHSLELLSELESWERTILECEQKLPEIQPESQMNKYKMLLLFQRSQLSFRRGDLSEALLHLTSLADSPAGSNSTALYAETLKNIGTIHFNRLELDIALSYYRKSIEQYNLLGDLHCAFLVEYNIGLVQQSKKNYPEAKQQIVKSLKHDLSIGDRHGASIGYFSLSTFYLEMEDYSNALENAFKALELSRNTGYKTGVAAALHNIGEIYCELGDFDSAGSRLKEALMLYSEIGNELRFAHCYMALGKFHHYQGELAEASAMYILAAEKYETSGCLHDKVNALISSAREEIFQDNWGNAKSRLEEALNISVKMHYKESAASAYCWLAEIELNQGSPEKALDKLQSAEKTFRNLGSTQSLAYCLSTLARTLLALGKSEEARCCCEEALLISRENKDEQSEATSKLALAEVLVFEGKLEEALSTALEAEQTFRSLFRMAEAARAAKTIQAIRNKFKMPENRLRNNRNL